MFCPQCGKQLPDDSVFCDACGARLDGQPAPAPEQGFGQPQNFAPEQNFDQPQNFAPEQKSGLKVPLIAGIAVLALALAGGAIFFLGKGKKGAGADSPRKSCGQALYGILAAAGNNPPARGKNQWMLGGLYAGIHPCYTVSRGRLSERQDHSCPSDRHFAGRNARGTL